MSYKIWHPHHSSNMAYTPYFFNMATLTERLGTKVRKLREQERMSQLALAQKAGLDLTTINEIENGNREPMLRTIWKISNALGVKLTQLFDF